MNQPSQPNTILIHNPSRQEWLHFQQPEQVFVAHTSAEVRDLLKTLEQRVEQDGYYAAGFFSFEAGSAFDPALAVKPDPDFPLAWFGIYRSPATMSELSPQEQDQDKVEPLILDWTPDVTEARYDDSIHAVKAHIARGETYQVNYTFRLNARFDPANSWPLFRQMIAAQGAHYGAFIDTDRFSICSASPELFLTLNQTRLVSKPMKGTAPRGLWAEHDLHTAEWLRDSEKNRAENVMIVDMVRNDMGKVADLGSVKVSTLFEIETYPTLFQMTSTVECRSEASYSDIFSALYPAASITGAPKASTMGIIHDLETAPRRIYTGSIGYFAPGREMQFNVAIRTVLIDKANEAAQYGVGGGIVWDSIDAAEFAECTTKAAVLTHRSPVFDLLETMLWRPGEGYSRLEGHLSRLTATADYFGRPFDPTQLRQQLTELESQFSQTAQRVRVRIASGGESTIESAPFTPFEKRPYRLGIGNRPVDSRNRFLYHKTTHRTVYAEAKAAVVPADVDDVLLYNERGELTETCIANVALELDGKLVTPPIECGLLPGVERSRLIEDGKLIEGILTLDDLGRATSIYLMNSVRGVWKATLVQATEPMVNHV